MGKQAQRGAAPPPVVDDARFRSVHNDPRFARMNKKKGKLQLDKRFAAVLKDERFQAVQGKYDKYGRRNTKSDDDLKRFYELEEEQEEDEEAADEDVEVAEDETTLPGKDAALSRLEYLNRMARGELGSASDSSDSSEEEDSADEEEDAQEKAEEDIPMGEETERFAILNCDWSRIRAVDLFALCQSFAPATGSVRDVTIYPSDYGLAKMKEEERHGPQGVWADDGERENATSNGDEEPQDDAANGEDTDSAREKDEDDQDDDEDSEDDDIDEDDPLGVKKSVTAAEAEGFDPEKLRQYELQKLKYYYAVVTCDSVKTAAAIFEQCDQLEYEASANVLDLRFVPSDMAFANAPKESCQRIPDTYKPAIFATQALQQTDIALTWEQDDGERTELLTRRADWNQVEDNDFAAYLASENSSSESEDDAGSASEEDAAVEHKEDGNAKPVARADKHKKAKLKKIKDRYRKLLLGSDAEDDSDAGGADGASETQSSDEDDASSGASSDEGGQAEAEDQEGEMEMSFAPSASDVLQTKRRKELEASLTPFELYERQKKLDKNQKKHEKRKKQKELEREQRALLKKRGKAPEQLVALREAVDDAVDGSGDDADNALGDRNFDMKQIAQHNKLKKLKGKRKAKELKKLRKQTAGLQEGFEFDAADPRFGALYQRGSQFQIDPTDSRFKQTTATQAIFEERRRRQQTEATSQQQHKQNAASSTAMEASESHTSDKKQLDVMVENLKRKAEQQQQKSSKKRAKVKA